jgi:YegS/Rv2252/BmrU family lipid kinase
MRRSVLIYNPRSGRQVTRRLLPAVLSELRAGFAVEAVPTAGAGDATRLARAAAGDHEVVFAMGGDGTLREAAVGLLGTGAALGPLPAGTANVLALAFGLPRDARAAARLLPSCRPQEVDVGVAGGEPFLMMASCGVDAAVMARQSAALKRLLGGGAVVWTALRQLWSYAYPEIELRFGGRHARVGLAVVSNIPYYGGAFRLAPSADYRDRRLDLFLFHGRGGTATFGLGLDLARGRHLARADVEATTVEEVEILGPPGVPLQVDGDVLAVAPPLTVGLAPQRLRVLLP